MIKVIIILILLINNCYAERLNIATASNFHFISKIISIKFQKKYETKIIIISDSTANIFTKIKNNAPFDIFISADRKHTKLLEKINCFMYKSYMYANGYLTLITKQKKMKKYILKYIKINKNIALSNNKLSPYGNSSKKLLKNIKMKNKVNIIYSLNINQVFSMIYHKSCEIGITSLSNIKNNKIINNHFIKIPQYMHPKIKQNILALNDINAKNLNKKFIKYLKSKKIKYLIKKNGYK